MKTFHTLGAFIAAPTQRNEGKDGCVIQDGGGVTPALPLLKPGCAGHILGVCPFRQIDSCKKGKTFGEPCDEAALRLGFRTLGKALLKQTRTVSSFFFPAFFEICRRPNDSTEEVGLNNILSLSLAQQNGSTDLQAVEANNWMSGQDILQVAATMGVSMLGPQAQFLQGSLCSELMTKYPSTASAA